MELRRSRHVGNDAVLKGTFKPYLTTNAAAPLFQKILERKMNANLCAGAIWTWREGVSCCTHWGAEPESVSAHSVGSSVRWAYTVENALSIIRWNKGFVLGSGMRTSCTVSLKGSDGWQVGWSLDWVMLVLSIHLPQWMNPQRFGPDHW